jgi:hypothetical protein
MLYHLLLLYTQQHVCFGKHRKHAVPKREWTSPSQPQREGAKPFLQRPGTVAEAPLLNPAWRNHHACLVLGIPLAEFMDYNQSEKSNIAKTI